MSDHPSRSRPPLVSVVVCTRNRGDSVARTIRSLLASGYGDFELVVVDQSEDGATAAAVGPLLRDGRLRYRRSPTAGFNIARQVGFELSRGAILLYTDDDCEAPAGWIGEMAAIFAGRPEVAVVFCDVVAGPHERRLGYVPVTPAGAGGAIDTLGDWRRKAGGVMGAGMGLRRAAVERLGGFDPMLDAGAPFRSGGDTDIGLRALLAGHRLYRARGVSVVHHGFRTYEQGGALMRGYMVGLAAVYAKLLRCGHWRLLPTVGYELWRTIGAPLIGGLARLRRPPVLKRIAGFAEGFARGLATPIDRRRQIFRPAGGAPPSAAGRSA